MYFSSVSPMYLCMYVSRLSMFVMVLFRYVVVRYVVMSSVLFRYVCMSLFCLVRSLFLYVSMYVCVIYLVRSLCFL